MASAVCFYDLGYLEDRLYGINYLVQFCFFPVARRWRLGALGHGVFVFLVLKVFFSAFKNFFLLTATTMPVIAATRDPALLGH